MRSPHILQHSILPLYKICQQNQFQLTKKLKNHLYCCIDLNLNQFFSSQPCVIIPTLDDQVSDSSSTKINSRSNSRNGHTETCKLTIQSEKFTSYHHISKNLIRSTEFDEIIKLYLNWKRSGEYLQVVDHYIEASKLGLIPYGDQVLSKSFTLMMNLVLQCGWLSGQGNWSWNLFLSLFNQSRIYPDLATVNIMTKGLFESKMYCEIDHLFTHLEPTFHVQPNLIFHSFHIRSLLLRGGKHFHLGMQKLDTIFSHQQLTIKFIGTIQKVMIDFNRLREAFSLVELAKRRGLQPITPLVNHLLLAAFTSGKPDWALSIYKHYFDSSSTPDEISITTMTYGLFKSKRYTESVEFLNMMQRLGMTSESACEKLFNHLSYQLLLHPPTSALHIAAADMLDYLMKNFQYPTQSKVINMYDLIQQELVLACSKFDSTKNQFNFRLDRLYPQTISKLPQMLSEKQDDLPELPRVYSCLFKIFTQYGSLNQCIELFDLIKKEKSLITPHALSCLLSRAFNEKHSTFIDQLMPYIISFNLPLYHVVIYGYKNLNKSQYVYRYFYQMIDQGYLPTSSIVRAVIVMLLREGRISDVNKLIKRLDKLYTTSPITIPDLESGLTYDQDDWNRIKKYLDSLTRRGIEIQTKNII